MLEKPTPLDDQPSKRSEKQVIQGRRSVLARESLERLLYQLERTNLNDLGDILKLSLCYQEAKRALNNENA